MIYSRAVIIFFLVIPITAHAYVDPNVGGWLYQLLFPMLIAIAGGWAILRQRVNAFFGRFFDKKNKTDKKNDLLDVDITKQGEDTKE